MFSFDVNVTAYVSGGGGGSGLAAPAGGTSGGTSSGSSSLLPLNKTMRITVNPLTKLVTVKLL
jgi:hypothetical protein